MKQPYRLVLCANGCQRESMGSFVRETDAIAEMMRLSRESIENVKIPVKFINGKSIEPVKYEIVVVKKRDESDPSVGLVRNDYGEFVEHETNSDMWLVIDKALYYKEERFWVYGYHPLTDRKDFDFIFENIVYPYAVSREDFPIVKLFINKVLIVCSSKKELITCKNKSDALRLYNKLLETCSSNKKIKYISFQGDCNSTKISRRKCIDEIKELTNWNEKKITRYNTKPVKSEYK